MWLLACSLLPNVKMQASTETRDADGNVERSEMKWEGRLDELPEGLVKMSGQLAATTKLLVKVQSKIDADAELHASVTNALHVRAETQVQTTLVAQLRTLEELGSSTAGLAVGLVGSVQGLVSSGTALVAGAQASLTNPKVITHLGLVKDGLTQSVSVVASSGPLIAKLATNLTGFSQHARLRKVDAVSGTEGYAVFTRRSQRRVAVE
jgi:hypothetical protein